MKLIKDLGMRYPTSTSKRMTHFGMFLCSCGKKFEKSIHSKTKSCGCLVGITAKKVHTSHGLWGTRIYRIHRNMMRRCNNNKDSSYKNYGGRGIYVCNEWMLSFDLFVEWALSNGYSELLTLDRINNDREYSPANCRWTTRSTQQRNSRKIISTNTSGYRGVSKNGRNWGSGIYINNKKKHLGTFKTAIEAAVAYDKYVEENNLEHTKNLS